MCGLTAIGRICNDIYVQEIKEIVAFSSTRHHAYSIHTQKSHKIGKKQVPIIMVEKDLELGERQ